jgi:hypothetical protein
MHPLCRVKTVHKPIKKGVTLALNGAWNRKFKVVAVTREPDENGMAIWTVCVEPLGSYYADGRTFPAPKRVRQRDIRAYADARHAKGGPKLYNYFVVEPRND